MNGERRRTGYARALGTGLIAVGFAAGCSGEPKESGRAKGEMPSEATEQAAALHVAASKIWPNPHINVCWESVPSPDDRLIVRDAIRKTWELESNVSFIGWGTCATSSTGLRIRLQGPQNVYAAHGKDLNGVVNGLTIANGSAGILPCHPGWTRERCVRGAAVRAFGHALGFVPEQNRINGTCYATTMPVDADTPVGDFDDTSVMSDCNPLRYNDGRLSATDVRGVQQFYGGPRSIAVASWAPNRVDAFIRGMDGALYQKWFDGVNWNGWTSRGGSISGPPAVVSWGQNRLDVFARGVDGALVHIANDGSTWGNWESLGGSMMGVPVAVATALNRLDVFVRGIDRSVRWISWNGSGWTSWQSLGGDINGNIEAIARPGNRIDIFARSDADQNVMYRYNNGGTGGWTPWANLGMMETLPEAVSLHKDRIDLIARNVSKEVTHGVLTDTASGKTWSGWINNLGGYMTSHPTAVARTTNMNATTPTGSIDVFSRAMDGFVYTKTLTVGSTWPTGWSLTNEIYTRGTPSAVAWNPTHVDLFVRGNDDSGRVTTWNSPGPWSAFAPLGGVFK